MKFFCCILNDNFSIILGRMAPLLIDIVPTFCSGTELHYLGCLPSTLSNENITPSSIASAHTQTNIKNSCVALTPQRAHWYMHVCL